MPDGSEIAVKQVGVMKVPIDDQGGESDVLGVRDSVGIWHPIALHSDLSVYIGADGGIVDINPRALVGISPIVLSDQMAVLAGGVRYCVYYQNPQLIPLIFDHFGGVAKTLYIAPMTAGDSFCRLDDFSLICSREAVNAALESPSLGGRNFIGIVRSWEDGYYVNCGSCKRGGFYGGPADNDIPLQKSSEDYAHNAYILSYLASVPLDALSWIS